MKVISDEKLRRERRGDIYPSQSAIPANESVSPVHHRMPLIRDRSELETWYMKTCFWNMHCIKSAPVGTKAGL